MAFDKSEVLSSSSLLNTLRKLRLSINNAKDLSKNLAEEDIVCWETNHMFPIHMLEFKAPEVKLANGICTKGYNVPYWYRSKLQELKKEYQETKSAAVLCEIQEILALIQSSIRSFVRRSQRLVSKIVRRLKKIKSSRDVRKYFRQIVRFHFKNMSDCSGSDANIFSNCALNIYHYSNNHINERSYKAGSIINNRQNS